MVFPFTFIQLNVTLQPGESPPAGHQKEHRFKALSLLLQFQVYRQSQPGIATIYNVIKPLRV